MLQITGIPASGANVNSLQLPAQPSSEEQSKQHGSEVIDSKQNDFKLDKSNILMLGPTGSG